MQAQPHVVALVLAFALTALASASGCAATVGDSCETSTDCGRALICETSLPEGYCTARDCDSDSCPDEGVCVEFRADLSFCMASCSADADCRDGYVCVQDFGPHPFCNAVASDETAAD